MSLLLILKSPAVGGANYSITAQGGSYTLTGASATVTRSRTITATGGSYAITGASATVKLGKRITATGGSYALAGGSAGLVIGRKIVASGGTYALTGSSAAISWSGESSGFSAEVELSRKWYVKRGKKLHIFANADDADDFIEAEARAEELVKQKTSRLARKKVRQRVITVTPEKTIEFTWLAQLVSLYSIPVNLPELIAMQDYERVMQIVVKAEQMQEDDDIEMLLLA